jgi:hypothetical protein
MAVAVMLFLAPAHIIALDSSNTGPAAKSEVSSSPSGSKGADGFVVHNGNGANGYSSWSSRNKSLEVDPAYAHRLFGKWTDPETGKDHTVS